MECGRTMIYFSTYENGVKVKRAGYAVVFCRGDACDVQIYYRGAVDEKAGRLQPVYMFRDGWVTLGNEIFVEEGMGATVFRTGRKDFAQSGRNFEELETIYLDGVKEGVCGGRVDGRELSEAAWTMTNVTERPSLMVEEKPPESEVEEIALQEEVLEESKELLIEKWTLQECMDKFPEMRLPSDGIRRNCCRMTLEDMEHLPEEWQFIKENHFLLHGYYEYHHLLLAKLSCRYGERYAIGVPGEFCYRNQYMAENFGLFDFAPLEPGRRRNGSFGYWYFYLEQ